MKRFLTILTLICTLALGISMSSASQQREAITEITLEMTQGLANPRAFKIVLRSDGTALYHGMANVPLEGKFSGRISKEEFDALAEFLTVRKFNKIKGTLGSASTATIGVSAPVVMTTVVEGGKQRTVTRAYKVKIDNPDAPAKELLEIENAITAQAVRIKWEKVKK